MTDISCMVDNVFYFLLLFLTFYYVGHSIHGTTFFCFSSQNQDLDINKMDINSCNT